MADNAIQKFDDQGSQISVNSIDDIKRLSLIFVKSGMFKTDRNSTAEEQMYQAGVKIIAGKEFGIAPFAAMRGINIIKGNAEMSANLMAAKVKRHPKYDYRVKQWDNDGCILGFYEIPYPGAPRSEWEELGESSFNLSDGQQAGLAGGDNWRKFSRNMYFARAISNGVRIYCPDIFYGAPVYTEGEITGELVEPEDDGEASVDYRESEALDGEVVTDTGELEPADNAPIGDEAVEEDAPTTRTAEEQKDTNEMSPGQRKMMMALLKDIGAGESDERHAYIADTIGRDVESSTDITKQEAKAVIERAQADLYEQLLDQLTDLMDGRYTPKQIRAAVGKLHTTEDVRAAITKMKEVK